MQTSRVDVDLGSRSYPVLIGSELLGGVGEMLREHGLKQMNAFVVTNPQVGALYFLALEKALAAAGFTRVVRHEIPASEEGKNWDEFSAVCAALLENFPDTGAAISADSQRACSGAGCRLYRCRRRCSRRWIRAWAGRWR